MPQATGLAAELKETIPGIDVELVRGTGGAFEVTVDDKLLFSKLNLDRFPSYQEIPTLIGV